MPTHSGYSSPKCFDWRENKSPDLPTYTCDPVTEDNLADMSDQYVAQAVDRASGFRHGMVLVPFGQDFRFLNASFQFGVQICMTRPSANSPTHSLALLAPFAYRPVPPTAPRQSLFLSLAPQPSPSVALHHPSSLTTSAHPPTPNAEHGPNRGVHQR